MSAAPRLSVLLPNYNYARFLPEAIESVLAQNYDDFEFIISDDNSADDSWSLIEHYAAKDARIRAIRRTRNQGMVAHWNGCLAAARGEYVKFIFGDDCLAQPDSLRRFVSLLDDHPQARLAASGRLVINEHSRVIDQWQTFERGLHSGRQVVARCLQSGQNLIGEPTAVLFRRDHARRGFDPRWRQIVDQELWCHLLLAGDLVYEPEPLAVFRVHAAQQTAVNRVKRIGDVESLELLDRYLGQLDSAVLPQALRHRIIFQSLHQIRRRRPTPPEIADACRGLRAHLPGPAHFRCWIGHRLRRPFQNLHRHWMKSFRGPRSRPARAIDWKPLRRSCLLSSS